MGWFGNLSEIWDVLLVIIEITYLVASFSLIIYLILDNRNPIRTMSWAMVLILLPVIGLILYLFIGQNFRKAKLFSRKGILDFERIESLMQKQKHNLPENIFLENPKIKSKAHIITLLLNNSKALLSKSNRVKIFNTGTEKFESLLIELDKAKNHIHLEYYIIEDDFIGNKIKDLLIKKARQGVKIRIIYDDVGSWELSKKYLQALKSEGIEIFPFMPVKFPYFTSKINYRNHRKIVVIDGITGFVGGMNIADRYMQGAKDIGPWRDTHLMLEGQAVKDLQMVFIIDWYFVSRQKISGQEYLPHYKISENHLIQITASGPDSNWESIMQAYFSAIATAQEYIFITSPYFLPTESILLALKTAGLSGIDVRILLPFKSDSPLTYWSTLSFIDELLEAGIKVYFYSKGFIHSKVIIVDDVFASVGTANMDYRSFNQNFEVNALIYDEEIALELKKHYLQDLEGSSMVSMEEWANRKTKDKIKSSIFRLFSPLL